MAPKKKKQKYQGGGGSGNPNTALVIFLVISVLLVLGLGFFSYQGYQEKITADNKTSEMNKTKDSAYKSAEWGKFMAQEARMAVAGPVALEDKATDEMLNWKQNREKLLSGQDFKDEKEADKFKEFIKLNQQELGWVPENPQAGAEGNKGKPHYQTTYIELNKKLKKELDQTRADLQVALQDKQKTEKLLEAYKSEYDPAFAKISDNMKAIQKQSIDEAKAKHEQLIYYLDTNNKLKAKIEQQQLAHEKELRLKLGYIAELETALKRKTPSGGVISPIAKPSQPHALILDISRGKPLWDRPKGKIVQVDTAERKVIINIGRAQGAVPSLTFNVFSGSKDEQAMGQLKGTIEVINVLDDTSSLARITSLYTSEGQPIALYDPRKGGVIRAADNPLKAGDLLFNMFWKAHVGVVGKLNVSGYSANSNTEEHRRLSEFLTLLRKQGIVVDGYMDLADGKIKGKLTPETQFIIVGQKAIEERRKEGKDDPGNVTAKEINAKIDELRKQAVERGIFIISGENFLNMIGYRMPASALSQEVSDFVPRLPAAQANPSGGVSSAGRTPG